jgi:outer membrane receptor protein involved in Fe transport
MVYASFATGYKSGGTNTDRIDPELDYIFDPETSEAFEVGWKASFPEQALRVNLALHKTDIDDLQVNYVNDNLFVLQNAGRLETYGGELEVTWLPTDSLTLTSAYARTEGEFDDFQGGFCWIAYPFHTGRPDPGDPSGGENPVACDRSGEDLHSNPEFLFASAKQAYDISDGIGGFILAEYTYLGKSESVRHDPYQTASSYDLLNLRLGFEFERYDAVVTLWGRNILDEEYRVSGFDAASNPGRVLATAGEPATYGISFRKNF